MGHSAAIDNERSDLHAVAQWAAGLFLFAATASVVWWQNSRLTVLYDLSGVLEPAKRIAQGDLPYLDFPLPYAPLTFLTQAALIRITGAVYWHHIVYCCIVAGLGTVLAWRILLLLFRGRLLSPGLTAFLLSLPLAVLGIYCIFPHPFYDPDAMFVILLGIFLLLRLESKGFPPVRTFLVGSLLAVPLFVKQNIGLAFLGSIGIALLAMIAVAVWKKTAVRPFLLLIGGAAVGLAAAILIIHASVGVDNYLQWTITFAAARRTPSLLDMLSVYADWMLALWVAMFLAGAFVLKRNTDGVRWRSIAAVALMAMPFVWPVAYLLFDADSSERAERLAALWPLVFIVSIAIAYIIRRRLTGVASTLPFILICTAHGVFLSQQLWGSTYAIWPVLIILLGLVLVSLYNADEKRGGNETNSLAAIVSISLLVAGGFYVYSNERLDYVNFEDGEMAHSTLPQLAGLSMRGDWIPDFEELVRYTDENIPRDAGILYLPGEDLFYYTTGRHPHFPVLLFDVTNNRYNAAEIRDRVLASDIEWVIVKNDTQIEADKTIDSKDAIFELLKPDFRSVDSLNNYEIYKRRHADDPPDENDDENGDNGDDDNNDNSGE